MRRRAILVVLLVSLFAAACRLVLGISDLPDSGGDSGQQGDGASSDASDSGSASDTGPVGDGGVTVLATNVPSPWGIAVDSTNVYWTSRMYDGGVWTCPKTGCAPSPVQLVSHRTMSQPIAVDSTDVYWGDFSTTGVIMRYGLGDAGVVQIDSANGPYALAFDTTYLYWTEYYSGLVLACLLSNVDGCNGSASKVPASTPGSGHGIAVDATNVYWTIPSQSLIASCPKSGCASPQQVAGGQTTPEAIAVDTQNVYWTNYDLTKGAVMRCAVGGCGSPTPLASAQPNASSIAVDAQNVYWTNDVTGGDVMKCAITGCAQPTSIASGQNHPAQLAIDSVNVYWTRSTLTANVGEIVFAPR